MPISIHALLAESDESGKDTNNGRNNFYPRSPCGERLASVLAVGRTGYFYPRSPCGERPGIGLVFLWWGVHFYPRSPCGERQPTAARNDKDNIFLSTLSLRRATEKVPADVFYQAFLSTLSLRRATVASVLAVGRTGYFYPRSPCGERRNAGYNCRSGPPISIHALLAESDFTSVVNSTGTMDFYPRSPCGERPDKP